MNLIDLNQAFSQRGVWVSSGHPIADFFYFMQWDEKELDTQFIPNVYFWIPNSEILTKALSWIYIYTQ